MAHGHLKARTMAQDTSQNWQRLQRWMQELLGQSMKSTHSRMLTCGFVVELIYLLLLLVFLLKSVFKGDSTPVLNFAFAYLALEKLWQQRRAIARLTATEEERWVGYAFILGGAIAFPCFFSKISMQAFLAGLMGLAMAYWLWVTFILLSLYPDWIFLSNAIRKVVTPTYWFEEVMAWSGSLVLQGMGHPATPKGVYITLPQGAVKIASGCSGFDLAFLIVGTSVVLGLFMQQKWPKIWLVAVLGAILALIFNIPRVVLLTFAAVYWGKPSFDFWHGPIGGQIFSGVLLTIYYYMAMAFFTRKAKAKNQ
jgi:exosortase/archaeosortase family protein